MKNQKGFTLLEILLVVAALAILAGIVILALNPSKQLAETRNAQRRVDVNTILNSIYQYNIDNESIPTAIPIATTCQATSTYEICKTGGVCSGLVSLYDVTLNELYLTEIPIDPTGSSTNGTGYYITKSSNDRVTVCAPNAERSAEIQVKR